MAKKKNKFRSFINKILAIYDKSEFLHKPWVVVLLGMLVTFLLMLGLILLVYHASIPNPNMVLITGLVICSSLFGWFSGMLASFMMIGYSMFFFSTDHSWWNYTEINAQKLVVIIIGCVLSTIFICIMRRNYRYSKRILTQANQRLANLSERDPLTGTQNRYAFRNNLDKYLNKDLIIMIMDIDNFKEINDSIGHQGGDKVLRLFAHNLIDTFGDEHSYRYGGDEFLVLSTSESVEQFENKLKDFKQLLGSSSEYDVRFSAGFVFGKLNEKSQFSEMFKRADCNLYDAKSNGKDCFKGSTL